jgi:hypothetical protein
MNSSAQEVNLFNIELLITEGKNTNLYSRKAGFNSYNVRPKTIIPKPHNFNSEQKLALIWFSRRGIDLSDHFKMADLNKAFRKLAFDFHPDYNQTTEAHAHYLELFKNKELLKKIFN